MIYQSALRPAALEYALGLVAITTTITAIAAVTIASIIARRRRRELAAALADAAVWRSEALRDPLTHLPNRRAAAAEVNARLANGSRLLLALIDLDDFKAINDTYGHPIGDDLLAVVAARLTTAVPPGGFVARLGGDEFLVLLPVNDHDPTAAITPMLNLLAEPVQIDTATLRPRASAGVTTLTTGGRITWRHLITRADRALYRAKTTASGVATFDPLLDTVTATDTARPRRRRRDHRLRMPDRPTGEAGRTT